MTGCELALGGFKHTHTVAILAMTPGIPTPSPSPKLSLSLALSPPPHPELEVHVVCEVSAMVCAGSPTDPVGALTVREASAKGCEGPTMVCVTVGAGEDPATGCEVVGV